MRRRTCRLLLNGALAVIRWGEPRLTLDVDLTILTGFGGEERYIDALLHRDHARRPDACQFAVQDRAVLSETKTIPVDETDSACFESAGLITRPSRNQRGSAGL
jgi:hypothetical protein